MQTKTIASTTAQNNFGQVLDDVSQNNTRYIVKRRNAPQAILLSLSDFKQLLSNQAEQEKMQRLVRELSPMYQLGDAVEITAQE